MSDKLKEAVKTLCEALREDKSEGSYYYSWQANIAMAFQDEFNTWVRALPHNVTPTQNQLHSISNAAAKNFLDLLTRIPETEDINTGG